MLWELILRDELEIENNNLTLNTKNSFYMFPNEPVIISWKEFEVCF